RPSATFGRGRGVRFNGRLPGRLNRLGGTPRRFHCWIRGYVDAVVIGCGGEIIARHPRSYAREEVVFDPLHYAYRTDGTIPTKSSEKALIASGHRSTPSCPCEGQPWRKPRMESR